MHPIDTITSTVMKCIETMEDSSGSQLTYAGCMAKKLIHAMDRMRFKDTFGDPRGFRTYLAKHGKRIGHIERAHGNRIHLYFHLSELYLRDRDMLMYYLENHSFLAAEFREQLIYNYKMKATTDSLRAMAIISRTVSASWVKKFYRPKETAFTQAEAYSQIVKVIETIDNWILKKDLSSRDIPSHLKKTQKGAHGDIKTWIYDLDICDEAVRKVLLKDDFSNDSITCDVFGEVLKKEECIWTGTDDNNVSTMVQISLFQVNKVLKRQYRSYEKLDMSNITTRVNNIGSEELVGMFSAGQKQRPNATMLFHAAKIKYKKNKTHKYFEELIAERRDQLLPIIVQSAVTVKARSVTYIEEVLTEVTQRVRKRTTERLEESRKKWRTGCKKWQNPVAITKITKLRR